MHTATLVGNYILSMLYRGSCIILMMKLRIIMGDICSIDKGIVTDLLILLLYLKIAVLKILVCLVLAINAEIESAGMWYRRVHFNMLVHMYITVLSLSDWETSREVAILKSDMNLFLLTNVTHCILVYLHFTDLLFGGKSEGYTDPSDVVWCVWCVLRCYLVEGPWGSHSWN